MGFGGACGGSRAARADGAAILVWNRRAEQLARVEGDWAARTATLGTADAAKWVKRREYCFDAAAGNDQHGYADMSLPAEAAVTGRVCCKLEFFSNRHGAEQLEAADPKRQPVRAAAS